MDKVLVVEYCPSPQGGGAERSMRSFCEFLVKRGNPVYIGYRDEGSYLDGEAGQIYSGRLKLNVPVLTAGTACQLAADVLKTRQFCRKHGIDVVITHVVHAAAYLRAVGALSRVKTGMLLKWRLSMPGAGMKIRWGMAGINRHIAVSRYTLDFWRQNGVPLETSEVVPEGITSRNLQVQKDDDGQFHIAFAARIVQMKGLHVLLEAVARLIGEGFQVKVSVAGGFKGKTSPAPDKYHCELEDQVERSGLSKRVHFLGFVDPVEELFARADLVVVPSILPEAQPLAIMQAMATGSLVLASDIGGVGEVLKPRFADFLVTPGDVNEIYQKIKNFIGWSDEKRQQIGRTMKDFVITNYQLEPLLSKTAKQLNIT